MFILLCYTRRHDGTLHQWSGPPAQDAIRMWGTEYARLRAQHLCAQLPWGYTTGRVSLVLLKLRCTIFVLYMNYIISCILLCHKIHAKQMRKAMHRLFYYTHIQSWCPYEIICFQDRSAKIDLVCQKFKFVYADWVKCKINKNSLFHLLKMYGQHELSRVLLHTGIKSFVSCRPFASSHFCAVI